MATITINAATAGTTQARTLQAGGAYSKVNVAEIFVTPSGTYDQAASESIEITNAKSAIENSRRNGKTVTLVSAMGGQSAYDVSGAKHYEFRTAVVNSGTLDCTIFEVGGSELADGAIPTLNQTMSVIVKFTEA
jgi:hypothetical protein